MRLRHRAPALAFGFLLLGLAPSAWSQKIAVFGSKGCGCEAPPKCSYEISCEPTCGSVKGGCWGHGACCCRLNPLAPLGRAIVKLNVALRELLTCRRCGHTCGKGEPTCGCDGDFSTPMPAGEMEPEANPFREDATPPPAPLPPAASQPRRMPGSVASAVPIINMKVSTHRSTGQPQATPNSSRTPTPATPSPSSRPTTNRNVRTASVGEPTLAEPLKLTAIETD